MVQEPLFFMRAVVRDGKMQSIEARKSAAVDNIGRALRECTFKRENQRFYLLISSEAGDAQNFSITSPLSLWRQRPWLVAADKGSSDSTRAPSLPLLLFKIRPVLEYSCSYFAFGRRYLFVLFVDALPAWGRHPDAPLTDFYIQMIPDNFA